MEMVEVKTVEMQGAMLDWVVAQICIAAGNITDDESDCVSGLPFFDMKSGRPCLWGAGREQKGTRNKETGKPWVFHGIGGFFSPSTDWDFGGPLLEEHMLRVYPHVTTNGVVTSWAADMTWPCNTMPGQCGPTALVAACRAIVMKQLGPVVRVPKELMP